MDEARTIRIPVAVIALVVACLSACGTGSPELDVQTFELEYIDADDAVDIIAPYVFTDREGAPGRMSAGEGGTITVRETPDMLAKIERVLEEFDRPPPTVNLRFQLIEADGAGPADSTIADVEAALREVFRFEGYRLLTEARARALPWSEFTQLLTGGELREGWGYRIRGMVGEVREAEAGGTARLEVALETVGGTDIFRSTVNARIGQTVVLGTAKPDPASGALILTVRPELEGR